MARVLNSIFFFKFDLVAFATQVIWKSLAFLLIQFIHVSGHLELAKLLLKHGAIANEDDDDICKSLIIYHFICLFDICWIICSKIE